MGIPKLPTKTKTFLLDYLDPVTQFYPQIVRVAIVNEPDSKYKATPIKYVGWITNKGNFLFAYGVDPNGKLHGYPPQPMEKFDEYIEFHKYDVVGIYDVKELKNLISKTKTKNQKAKENKIMLENTNVTATEATTIVPTATPATPATPAETASVPAGATPIDNVADFLKMVHNKHTGLADGKIKVTLDEIKNRLGGKIKLMQLEKTANEGRNFYIVKIDEGAYMYSFKMMTTILQKWEDACGGLDNLNKMLEQANIIGIITDGEYNGKRYSKFDIE